MRFEGTMGLNVELSRWERVMWIASSVDLLGQYAKCSGGFWDDGVDVTSLSKHFMATYVSATGR